MNALATPALSFASLNLRGCGERRLSTFTIGWNPTSGRYVVRCDRSGELVGAGYATVEAAERAHLYDDLRRVKGALVSLISAATAMDSAREASGQAPTRADYTALIGLVDAAARAAGLGWSRAKVRGRS